MLVKNRWLDGLLVFTFCFFFTYFLRFLIAGGDYSFSEKWGNHLAMATGLTTGFVIIPAFIKWRKKKR
ncbi:hypothetical protein JCM19046_2866 [Bacillus sp. JCM 19046]|nr:hypothetical protein JCM19045_444 [Bacillus sp. JCM 19045]GAF18300.1 hypothetical protein JCM19046_2866 [Bacillus sp. JCM 19046]